jgi:hypothetical protein
MYSMTAKSKNIEKMVAMIDWFETPAYSTLTERGIEGYTFRWNPDQSAARIPVNGDNTGVDQELYFLGFTGLWSGYQAIFPRVFLSDPAHRPAPEADLAQYRQVIVDLGNNLGYDGGQLAKYEAWLDGENGKWEFLKTPDSQLAFATIEESDLMAAITPDLKTYIDELFTGLVMGTRSLNNWDSYMADLKRLGLDELVAICQARLDRAKN